jgi:hypothetical protein
MYVCMRVCMCVFIYMYGVCLRMNVCLYAYIHCAQLPALEECMHTCAATVLTCLIVYIVHDLQAGDEGKRKEQDAAAEAEQGEEEARQKKEKVLGCIAFALYTDSRRTCSYYHSQESVSRSRGMHSLPEISEIIIISLSCVCVLWHNGRLLYVCIVCVYVYMYVHIYTHTLIGLL